MTRPLTSRGSLTGFAGYQSLFQVFWAIDPVRITACPIFLFWHTFALTTVTTRIVLSDVTPSVNVTRR
jgi:hypothetical protein